MAAFPKIPHKFTRLIRILPSRRGNGDKRNSHHRKNSYRLLYEMGPQNNCCQKKDNCALIARKLSKSVISNRLPSPSAFQQLREQFLDNTSSFGSGQTMVAAFVKVAEVVRGQTEQMQ